MLRRSLEAGSDRLVALAGWKFALLPGTQLLLCLLFAQLTLGSLLCTESPHPALTAGATFLWWLLAASLPLGLVAIGLRQLRLSYLVLLALVPVFLACQQVLLGQGLLVCNWF